MPCPSPTSCGWVVFEHNPPKREKVLQHANWYFSCKHRILFQSPWDISTPFCHAQHTSSDLLNLISLSISRPSRLSSQHYSSKERCPPILNQTICERGAVWLHFQNIYITNDNFLVDQPNSTMLSNTTLSDDTTEIPHDHKQATPAPEIFHGPTEDLFCLPIPRRLRFTRIKKSNPEFGWIAVSVWLLAFVCFYSLPDLSDMFSPLL